AVDQGLQGCVGDVGAAAQDEAFEVIGFEEGGCDFEAGGAAEAAHFAAPEVAQFGAAGDDELEPAGVHVAAPGDVEGFELRAGFRDDLAGAVVDGGEVQVLDEGSGRFNDLGQRFGWDLSVELGCVEAGPQLPIKTHRIEETADDGRPDQLLGP
ncbi:hypothetical protein V493_07882, partial [Pseudogymnoascus sp. VKM F-4281 (FW-2241)]